MFDLVNDVSPRSAIAEPKPGQTDKRHSLLVRLWHWINALAVITLIMSGASISNAHPRLYWGQYGANPDRAWLILPEFPGWMTIPSYYSLADGRLWHFFFAWVLAISLSIYLTAGVASGRLWRTYRIAGPDLAPNKLWDQIRSHARLRFGSHAEYNTLQKLAYLMVVVLLIPIAIATGMALSPGLDAAFHWLPAMFGGRPSARSIHFIVATALAAFLIGHVLLVLLSHPVSLLRGMVTGGRPARAARSTNP